MTNAITNILVLVCIAAVASTDTSVHSESFATSSSSGPDSRGLDVSSGEFSWIVALMKAKVQPAAYFCGGTLISSNFVLSAAQCFRQKDSDNVRSEILQPSDVFAIFGAHDLKKPYELGKDAFALKRIIIHDDWKQNTPDYDADLALLEFPKKVISVKPVALWTSASFPPSVTSEGTVIGWTKSEKSSSFPENLPKKLTIPIQTNEECFLTTNSLLTLSSRRTFCAGFRSLSPIFVSGFGVCRGDRGSGMIMKIDGLSYLRGVMSVTLDEAESNCDVSRNGVYADVLKFRNWIAENIHEPKEVSCVKKFAIFRKSTKCHVEQAIDDEAFNFGKEANPNILEFRIVKRMDVSFLPRNIGKKFPNLEDITVTYSNLTILRDFYFKDMKNVRSMKLSFNNIAIIEAGAFNDLISVTEVFLKRNKLQTLDDKLFAKMINLEHIYLTRNKLKFLSPTVFKISGGKIKTVDLGGNVCVNRLYHANQLGRLEGQLLNNCNKF